MKRRYTLWEVYPHQPKKKWRKVDALAGDEESLNLKIADDHFFHDRSIDEGKYYLITVSKPI